MTPRALEEPAFCIFRAEDSRAAPLGEHWPSYSEWGSEISTLNPLTDTSVVKHATPWYLWMKADHTQFLHVIPGFDSSAIAECGVAGYDIAYTDRWVPHERTASIFRVMIKASDVSQTLVNYKPDCTESPTIQKFLYPLHEIVLLRVALVFQTEADYCMQLHSAAADTNGNWQTADTCRQATECEMVGHAILFCDTFEKPDIIKKANSSGHQQATYRYGRKTMNTEWLIHPYIFTVFQFTWIYIHGQSKSHAEPQIHLGISLASISSCSAFKKNEHSLWAL